jgi:ABC-type multidrug transport system ATPase subunit
MSVMPWRLAGWLILLLNSGIFQPLLLFGNAFPQTYRKNETLPLRISLPKSDSSCHGLFWQDLSVVAADENVLLHPSSGFVESGHVCGILGPSGAGKSTFLSSIAGRPEASLHVEGHVLQYHVLGRRVDCGPVRPRSVAWLQQHDAFFERLTVQETLDMAVFLELPDLSVSERNQVVQSCLDSLGLSSLKSRHVGSPKQARTSDGATLSGGEMRRLSVAVELVVSTTS